jgi:putative acetyltransferase
MIIREDDLTGSAIRALLTEHLEDMALHSPPESVHALDIDSLMQPNVTFWSIWDSDSLMGCGAIKQLDIGHVEIKSMRTASAHRRKGVAAQMLEHILRFALTKDYHRLSLETGSMDAFKPARQLYLRYGFEDCEPFAEYVEDPNSVFMTKTI